ncbi:hypothetical protein [Demequina sp. NBRC 110056]|uniref:hypothetical protein n=1 Tax=Demequina sp. NBRC 110056 TaxID=1570345 RepID=UPI0009FD27F1|nr:hypothetical protein [Demequina sp. NBRC 110056]
MVVALGLLVLAFVVGLMPFVPEGAKQVTWLVAIALAAAWAVIDWRRRERAKAERASLHRERMAARGMDVPPSERRAGEATPDDRSGRDGPGSAA